MNRLKKLGEKLLGGGKAKEDPREVPTERRAGRRARLPIAVRFTMDDRSTHEGRLRDVNRTGFCIEPARAAQVGNRMSIDFEGYPRVCPAFVLVGKVRRILKDTESGTPVAMGIEIDRGTTSP